MAELRSSASGRRAGNSIFFPKKVCFLAVVKGLSSATLLKSKNVEDLLDVSSGHERYESYSLLRNFAAFAERDIPRIDLKTARKNLEGRIPLVAVEILNKKKQDPQSIAEARDLLNKEIEDTEKEVDEKLVYCHGFEKSAPKLIGNLEFDLNFILQEIGHLTLQRTEQLARQRDADQKILDLEEAKETDKAEHSGRVDALTKELERQEKDLEASQHINGITACGGFLDEYKKKALIQEDDDRATVKDSATDIGLKLVSKACNGTRKLDTDACRRALLHSKDDVLMFSAPQLQEAVDAIQTPDLRRSFLELMLLHPKLVSQQTTPVKDYDRTGHGRFRFLSSRKQQYDTIKTSIPRNFLLSHEFKVSKAGAALQAALDPMTEGGDNCQCPKEIDANCHALNEKAAILYGKAYESVEVTKGNMQKLEAEYQEHVKQQQLAMKREVFTKGEMGQALVETSKRLQEVSEKRNGIQKQLEAAKKDYEGTKKQCKDDLRKLINVSICSLKTIRDAIHSKSPKGEDGKKPKLSDCVMGNWQEMSCLSAVEPYNPMTCDETGKGGIQIWKRAVTSPPNELGTKCGAETMKVPCAKNKCPENCEVGPWSEWSECTAECDQGTESRNRNVLTPARFGGDVCPSLYEDRSCSREPCAQDCELSEWTEWGACAAPCNDGLETSKNTRKRVRKEVRSLIGLGDCAKEDDPTRYETRICATGFDVPPCPLFSDPAANLQRQMEQLNPTSMSGEVPAAPVPVEIPGLPPMPGMPPVPSPSAVADMFAGAKCGKEEGEQDVLLALDLSEGVGNAENFIHLQTFTKMIIRRLSQNKGAKVGLLTYGNGGFIPGEKKDEGLQTIAADVKVSLGAKSSVSSNQIDALEWSRGFSNAAQVLAAASQDFEANFRSNAKQTLVLLTDGSIPSIFKRGVKDAATKLRNMGVRIMIIALNGQKGSCSTDLAEMSNWVGQNDSDRNIMLMPGYQGLEKKFADNFMLHLCDAPDLSMFSDHDYDKLAEPDPRLKLFFTAQREAQAEKEAKAADIAAQQMAVESELQLAD